MGRVSFTPVFIFLFAASVHAQLTPEHYLEKLKNASSPQQFNAIIESIEIISRKDSLHLEDYHYKAIIKIAEEISFSDKVLPDAYRWVGLRYANGRMDEAIVYFLESTTLYEKQKKRLAEALSCFEVGLIHHKAKNFEAAKEYYNKALLLGRDSLDHRAVINCYNGIGLIFREEGKYEQAMDEFRKALQVAVKSKDIAWIGIMEGNVGSIFFRMRDFDSSLYHYRKNLTAIKKVKEEENEIETYVHISRVFIEKKSYREALIYLDSGLHVIETKKVVFTDFFNPLDEIYEAFALAYEGLGDYKKAYHYYTLFHQIQEKKQLQQKGQSLSQLQSTYTFKQKQSELDLLHKINEANLTIITQQHYAQIASLVVIAILAGLALFVYRISKQRKKLNIELKAANTELERLNTTKDKLFSVVSHDLRGPLLNLRAMIGMLNAGHIEPGEFNQFIEKINQQLIASGSALDNLLHWAKSQLSDMKLQPESLLISKKVDKVIQGLMTEAKKKDIELINEVPTGLTAFADKNQLEIVLRNLISNALKFTDDKGFVKIGGTRVDDESVEIFVEDNGIGMESKDIERLFQPGKQFTRTGTHDEKGTGIGLIITKEMVKANGGDIRVTSEKSKGSRFVFSLPAR